MEVTYPQDIPKWPLLSGLDVKAGSFQVYVIGILIHKVNPNYSETGFVTFDETIFLPHKISKK